VYRATERDAERSVALKVLLPDWAGDANKRQRFLDEAEKARKLDHPNIVRVLDVGDSGGRPYIAFQLIDGQDLSHWLATHRPTPQQAVALMLPVVDAVAAAHRAGLVHRDLKPANILIDRDGKPYVTDFGLAATDWEMASGLEGGGAGTPRYMAPEQLAAQGRSVTERTDVFALGMILYELLTGQRPWPFQWTKTRPLGEQVRDYLELISERPPKSPRMLNPDVPAALARVCLRALERDPFQRFSDCLEFADDLRSAMAAPHKPDAQARERQGKPAAISHEFQREYLRRLPLPLVQLYARAHNAKDPRSRYDNTFYLFEVTVKLAASTAVAAYLDEKKGTGPIDAQHPAGRAGQLDLSPFSDPLDRLLAKLALPSFGQWVSILRELARHFGTGPGSAARPLGALWQQLAAPRDDLSGVRALFRRIKHGPDGPPADAAACSLLDLFDALVPFRAGVFGQAGPEFETFYTRELGPLLFPAANELLADGTLELLGPRGARLVSVADRRPTDDGRVEIGIRELIGHESERAASITLAPDEAATLEPNRVAVLWPGRPAPLRLDPLVQYRERDLGEELLFLDRERNTRQAQFLGYTTGQVERDAAQMAGLLSRVVGRPVTVDQLRELAQHSMAEAPSLELLPSPPAAGGEGLGVRGAEPEAVVGDYELLAQIGHGGMGVVYLARQRSLGRLVALKMLPADLTADDVAVARFRREIRHLARSDHPHIVKILSSGATSDDRPYYTMEYVLGCDLETLWQQLRGVGVPPADRGVGVPPADSALPPSASSLGTSTWANAVLSASRKKREQLSSGETVQPQRAQSSQSPEQDSSMESLSSDPLRSPRPLRLDSLLPPFPTVPEIPTDPGGYVRRVCTIIRDAALALQSVHDQGVVHRDVKPANLMLTPDGSRVVLMDFGLAKGQSAGMTSRGASGLLGTLRYAAPEQLAAATLKVGPQADVRGLGVTLWELLTRRRLFGSADDEAKLAASVLHDEVPALRTIDRSFDRDLEAIVARATERNAADRIESAGRLAEYLQLWLDGRSVPIRTPGRVEQVRRWVRHNPSLAGLAATVATLLVVVAAGSLVFAHRERDRTRVIGKALDEKSAALTEKTAVLAREEVATKSLKHTQARLFIDRAMEHQSAGRHDEALLDLFRAWKTAPPQDPLRDSAAILFAGRIRRVGIRLTHDERVEAIGFDALRNQILTASNNRIQRWDGSNGSPVEPTRAVALGYPVALETFSPDGRFVAGLIRRKRPRVWDADTGTALASPSAPELVTAFATSPDGARMITGDIAGTVQLCDARNGVPVGPRVSLPGIPRAVAFTPDGPRAVITLDASTLQICDCNTGKPIGEPLQLSGASDRIVFSPTGSVLATLTETTESPVRIWDTRTGRAVGEPLRHESTVTSVAFSPDGKRVVTGSVYVRVCEVETGRAVGEPLRHESLVSSVAFSPDGKRVVTGSLDKTARVWEVETGRAVGEPLRHEANVTSVAFSPDGKRVVTGSDDKTARVWEVETGRAVGEPLRHESSVNSVAFSPDGNRGSREAGMTRRGCGRSRRGGRWVSRCAMRPT
jgi:serine/threonine protein kinase/WD40 repeat protein